MRPRASLFGVFKGEFCRPVKNCLFSPCWVAQVRGPLSPFFLGFD